MGAHHDRRKVAKFSTNFVAYSQTFVYDEVQNHSRYDVEVFAHNRLNEDKFPFDKVHALNTYRSLLGKAEWLSYGITTFSPSHFQRIRHGNFDVLHAHFGPGSIYALSYKRVAKAPLIVTYHGYDVPVLFTKRRYYPEFWRYWLRAKAMLSNVDCFLAASDELAGLLIRIGAPESKVQVWRLGVRIPAIEELPPRNGTNCLMVGRFSEKKGFEYGLQAFGDVISWGLDATLHIVGDGELKPAYDALLKKLQIADRVKFLGVMKHEDVLHLMLSMDVLIAPSVIAKNGDRESGLLVAKEAAARFVPVIGTRHGGIPEIIDHEQTGFLVPERDAGAIATHLAELLRDANLRERLGRRAREKMEKEYDIVDRIAALETHYDEVIQRFHS